MEKKKIYISPSLQEANVGIGDYGTEKYRMNQLADILEANLKLNNNYEVYRSGENFTLSEAIADSNRINPDIHIALHSNAGGGVGPEIFVYKQGIVAEKLANNIYEEIMKIYYGNIGRGVKYSTEIREVRETNSPAVLIEFAFHDNEKDATWIVNNMDIIALAIERGIDKYFENKSNINRLVL